MSSPIYILSSLPTLDITKIFNDDGNTHSVVAVPTIEEFLNLCDRNLDPYSAQKIREALENPSDSPSDMVHQVMQYLGAVQDLVAQKRWIILGSQYAYKPDVKNEGQRGSENVRQDPWQGPYPQMFVNDSVPVSADAQEIVAQAAEQSDPLEREIYIIKSLWAFLDHCDSQYQHSIENLVIYAYKIKLYQRLISFDYQDGDVKWNALVEELSKKAGFLSSSITEESEVNLTKKTDTKKQNSGGIE